MTMHEIRKRFDFDAAHRLDRLPLDHKCSREHGHTYSAEIVVRGELEPTLRWVVDYAVLAAAWETVHDLVDHRNLNRINGLEVPTTEVLAEWIFRRLSVVHIGANCFLAQVIVHESSTTQASYPAEPLRGAE